MIHHLLVTEVGSHICVSEFGLQERAKVFGSGHFFSGNVIHKKSDKESDKKSDKSSPVVKLTKLPTGPMGFNRNLPDLCSKKDELHIPNDWQ